jgi:S-adenosylmethionine-dependent methyltransferase
MQSALASALERFDQAATAWRDHLKTPLERLRIELTWASLCQHLPRQPLDILDVGGGTGEMAVRLVRAGHTVTLLDPSPNMLAHAREQAMAVLGPQERPRLRIAEATVAELRKQYPQAQFSAVLCHATLEYLREETQAWQDLASFARPNALISIVVPNREAVPLHVARRGIMPMAMEALSTPRAEPDVVFGIQRRTYDVPTLRQRFQEVGIDPQALFGVRVAADYMPDTALAQDPNGVLQFELAAGAMDPYQRVARLLHAVGVKRGQAEVMLSPDDLVLEVTGEEDVTRINTGRRH